MALRTLPASVLTALAARGYAVFYRLWVEDPNGDLGDLTAEAGIDWHMGHTITRDIDQLSDTLSLRLRRDFGIPEQHRSLAPLMEGSEVNRDVDDYYAPRVDVGRRVELEVAIMEAGETPSVPGDWHPIFVGWIDFWDSAPQPMVLEARDLMAELLDLRTDAEFKFEDPAGMAIEDLMQDFLDQFAYEGPALYVPVSPAVNRVRWTVEPGTSVGEAIASLAESIGWSVRSRWDDVSESYRITLFWLDPEDVTPVHTFAAGTYLGIGKLAIDRRDIVNSITGYYTDRVSGSKVMMGPVEDAASIAAYGLRRGVIGEGSDSPIDSPDEWTALAEAALAALKDPIADVEAERLLFPFLQPGDVVQFAADDTNTDVPIVTAIKALRDDVGPGRERTYITGRAHPAGAYLRWRKRTKDGGTGGTGGTVDASVTAFEIVEVNTPLGQYTKSIWTLGGGVATAELYERDHATDWPTLDGTEGGAPNLADQVGVFPASQTQTETRSIAAGATRRGILIPLDRESRQGPRATATLTAGAGGVGTEPPALLGFWAQQGTVDVPITWVANDTILADPGRFTLELFRDSIPLFITAPAEDEATVDPYALPCAGGSGCFAQQFLYRGILHDTTLVFPDVEYSYPLGGEWSEIQL